MKRAVVFLFAMFMLAACSGGPEDAAQPGDEEATSRAVECTPNDSPLKVEAADLKFDTSCLAAEADEQFTLTLDNKDAAPHNISIYDKGGKQIFKGEPLVDPNVSHTYTVPAVPAGNHTFKCDIHPEMNGNFIAAA